MVQALKKRRKRTSGSSAIQEPIVTMFPKRPWKKGERNKWLPALRKIIGRSQKQFAAMMGVSSNVIINIENGKIPLKPYFAQTIFRATGASHYPYLRGDDRVLDALGKPYTRSTFDYWMARHTYSEETHINEFFKNASDTLFVLITAASKYKLKNKSPALRQSFLDWCDMAYKKFELEETVSDFLKTRKYIKRLTMCYKDWRKFGKDFQNLYKFKDDCQKPDLEDLTLEYECIPRFGACLNMRPPEGGIDYEHLVFSAEKIYSSQTKYAKGK